MRIDVHRHANLTMAKYLLNHLWMNTCTEQECRRTMAQVIETDMWKPGLLQEFFEWIKNVLARMYMCA